MFESWGISWESDLFVFVIFCFMLESKRFQNVTVDVSTREIIAQIVSFFIRFFRNMGCSQNGHYNTCGDIFLFHLANWCNNDC